MRAFAFHVLLVAAIGNAAPAARPRGRIGIVGGDTVDMGAFPAYEKRTAVFSVINIGNASLDITKVRHSCGCATSFATPSRLKPKETASIRIATIPGSLKGKFEKIAYVESTDPYQPVIKLVFKGNAEPLVTISPQRYVYAGRIALNTPWTKRFKLIRNRTDVRLGTPVVTGNYKTDSAISPVDGEEAAHALDLTILPADTPGRVKVQVNIPVLHPTNHPPLTIVVATKIGDEAFAIPHRLTLPTDGETVSRQFRLRVVALQPGSKRLEDVTWPAVEGVRFMPQGELSRDMLLFTAEFARPFLDRLQREKEIALHIPVAGATSAKIQLRSN